MNTSGFYSVQDGALLFAPNFVCAPTFTLLREEQATYTYPVEGWSWFNSEEEARASFGLPAPEQPVVDPTLPVS